MPPKSLPKPLPSKTQKPNQKISKKPLTFRSLTTPPPTLLSPSPSSPTHFLRFLKTHFPTQSSLTSDSLHKFLRTHFFHHPSFSSYTPHLFKWAPHFFTHHLTHLLLIRSLARSHHFTNDILPFLEFLSSNPCSCSVDSIFSCPELPNIYKISIDVLCRECRFDDACSAFEYLKKSIDGRVNVGVYNLIINGCCKNHGCYHKAVDWYRKMLKDRVRPDVYTFNILVSAAFKSGQFKEGLGWFGEMKKMGVKADVVSFNALISGFFKEGKFEEGVKIAREMVEIGCGFSSVTCNILIDGFVRVGRCLEICDFLVEFFEKGLVPKEFDCFVLVEELCGEGKIEKGLEMVDLFWEKGMYVNVVSCVTLIEGFRRLGKIEEVVRLMERMIEKEMVPDRITCNCVFEDLCHVGRTSEANRLRVLASKKGFEADEATFGILVNGFSKEGMKLEGEKVVNEMLDADLIPNIATYNHLMGRLERKNCI